MSPSLITPSTVRTAATKVWTLVVTDPFLMFPFILQTVRDFLRTMFDMFTSQKGKHNFVLYVIEIGLFRMVHISSF